MRNATRAVVLALLAFLSSVLIGVAAVITAAITVAATTALIVPGTGTPNANIVADYMKNAYDRYIHSANPTLPSECTGANCTLTGINYPASFWPLFFIGNWCPGAQCDKWNESVGTGVKNLAAVVDPAVMGLGPKDTLVIFGYSQGARVVSIEKENLATTLTPQQKDQVEIVLIGNISRPNGGLWSRLSFLPTIPILDVSFGNPTPTDSDIKTTDISFEYDGVSDFPVYPLNLLAVANAVAGFQYVHGYYLVPNGNGPTDQLPWGYTPDDIQKFIEDPNNPTKGDTTYVTIPAKSLPILQPFIDLGNATGTSAIVDPILELVQPALKVLIDTGYDRTANPGDPMTFRLIPRIDPVKLAADLAAAVVQGIEDATDGVPIVPTVTPPPTSPSTDGPSILAADNTAKLAQADQTELSKRDLQTVLRGHALDTSVLANPLKIDPKRQVDLTPKKPAPETDGSSNPVFKLPKLPKPAIGSVTEPKLPKRPKIDNPSLPRVTDLMPKLKGAQNGKMGTETATDQGAGEQQQGSRTSTNNGEQAAA